MRNPHTAKEHREALVWVGRRLIWERWLDGLRVDDGATPGRSADRDV